MIGAAASNLLDPSILLIFPRFTEGTRLVYELGERASGVCRSVATATSPLEASLFKNAWSETASCPLLLFHASISESQTVLLDAARLILPSPIVRRPVAVLLADGPECEGYYEGRRKAWNDQFTDALSREYLNIQIYEYSREWRSRPPRIR